MGVYQSVTRYVGDKPWMRPVARHVLPGVDRALLRVAGWKVTPFPTLLLTTTGHTTGHPHESPLWYLEDGGLVVIASNYGRREPDWSRNLRADPFCTVRVGRTTRAARASLVGKKQWPGYFDRFAAFYPSYRDYAARADREIPIWRLALLPVTP